MTTTNNTRDTLVDECKRLAVEYAHCYAFVGDDTMPLKHRELHAAIDRLASLADDRAARQGVRAARLIGWRTDDYLEETADPKMARNWEVHRNLLPIFEGDPHTKLAAQPEPIAAEPVASLRFQRGAPGHENDMPVVVSCKWLPDGIHEVYTAQPEPVAAEPMYAAEWKELYALREAVKGPDGFATWQDAATDERVRRVKAERALRDALTTPAPEVPADRCATPASPEEMKVYDAIGANYRKDAAQSSVWSKYVAGMVVAYLGGGVDDKRIGPIAGIIERRLWALTAKPEQAAPEAPAQPGSKRVTEDDWYDLAQRHVNRDWNSDNADGYLDAVKAVCRDFSAHVGVELEGGE